MKTVLIVDGMNLLFQMFYGMPARIKGKHGKSVHGTLGFVAALLKITRMISPTHVCVIFDGEMQNPRKLMLPEYKANREDYGTMEEDDIPFSQLPDIYRALDLLEIAHAESTDCEADDLIAAYVRTLPDECKIVISSFDSDFFQLISDRVSVLRYRGEKSVLCDTEYIHQRLGISPGQYADLKSLTGDIADNIKGARGIGPKRAAELLREFGSLENIIQRSDEIRLPSVRASVKESGDRLRLNYEIIKLSADPCVPFSIGEMLFTDKGMGVGEVLRGIGIL